MKTMQLSVIPILRRVPDADLRLALAVLASSLLHGLMLASWSGRVLPGSAFSWPAQTPLSVLIEKAPTRQELKPIVLSAKKAPLQQKPAAASPLAPDHTPANAADIPRYPFQPGVSVSEILYSGSIPARVTSALLEDEDYRQGSDIDEQPSAVAIRFPKYPEPAAQQTSSGWVIVLLFLDERGKVVESAAVAASESFSDYEQIVAEDLRGSVFTPGRLEGRAVKTRIFARVRFDAGAPDGQTTAKEVAPGDEDQR